MPVILSDRTFYGTLFAVDPEPRDLTSQQGEMMVVLARLLATYIERDRELEAANRIQRALERQTAILRRQAQLLDLAHDAILARDVEAGTILYWNQGAEQMYGWTKGEVKGRVAHTLLSTEFPRPLEEIHRDIIHTGRWESELVHTRRDGRRIVISSRWALQCDDQDEPVAILEINSDITERRNLERRLAEEALREGEERLRATFEQAAVGIAHVGLDGRFLRVNQRLCEIIGYSD
ncbi:MAG: PAS domain S-box protein, partial [Chloroflexota bacterium]|nr:PAS domain S-box protein [Chloroflexota bacterium]